MSLSPSHHAVLFSGIARALQDGKGDWQFCYICAICAIVPPGTADTPHSA
jgi:hypothetical protein